MKYVCMYVCMYVCKELFHSLDTFSAQIESVNKRIKLHSSGIQGTSY